MKGLLWALPEDATAREWARLSRSDDVQAFLALVAEERQSILEILATTPDDAERTYLQGQIAALSELPVMLWECAEAVKRQSTENDDEGEENGSRIEWLRRRIGLFRGV